MDLFGYHLYRPLDPLHGDGYQMWSGIGLAFFWPLAFYWHHVCHERRCFRWGHPHPDHGRPVCKKHHPSL